MLNDRCSGNERLELEQMNGPHGDGSPNPAVARVANQEPLLRRFRGIRRIEYGGSPVRLGRGVKRQLVQLVEKDPETPTTVGFRRFLQDARLSGTATSEEIRFLERLQFDGHRPTALFYYRQLQTLRDPLNFEN